MGQSRLEIAISAINQASAEVKALTSDLKKLTDQTQENNTHAKEQNDTLAEFKGGLNATVQELTGFSLGEIGLAGVMVGTVKAIKDSLDETVAYGSEVRKLSVLIGASSQESSKLISVSEALGVSYESLTRGLEAAIRKGYQPTIDGLEQMGEKYRSIQDPIERAKYLMDTFGRSGADLAPILGATRDQLDELTKTAEEAGRVMNDQDVEAVKKYQIQMNEFNESIDGTKTKIGMALIPALNDVMHVMTKSTEAVKENNTGWLASLPVIGAVYAAWEGLKATHDEELQKLDALSKSTDNQTQSLDTTRRATGAMIQSQYDLMQQQALATKAVQDHTAAMEEQKIKAAELREDLNKLTAQTLYNQAAQGLDADAALTLARNMGLVDEKSVAAQARLKQLKEQLDAGTISTSEYVAQVAQLQALLLGLPTKINVDILIKTTGDTKLITGDNGTSRVVTLPQQKAIGGFGGGQTVVGENGPELVDLPAGSFVVNNYDMKTSYNLTAHYPTYQDPNAAKNDLIALTMLKNPGAARWGA